MQAVTLPLPVWDGTTSGLQFILDQIAMAVTDTGGQQIKLRIGSATVPFGGAGTTGNVTVTHGMGSTPVAVLCTYLSSVTQGLFAYVASVGATTFQIRGVATAAPGANQTCYWLAIG